MAIKSDIINVNVIGVVVNMSEIVLSAVDPFGRVVTLTQAAWIAHILDSHPEMRGNENAVKDTIENPDFIYRSNYKESSELFFSKSLESTYPNLYIRVVVDFTQPNAGIVKTALFTKVISQNVKQGGLVYDRTNAQI